MRRAVDLDPEPVSIGLDTVAAWLESRGRPRMAEFVRSMIGMEKRHAEELSEWRFLARRLRERLDQYEKPEIHRPHCPTPPPEASG